MIQVPHYADHTDLAGGFIDDLKTNVRQHVWNGSFEVTDTHIEFDDSCGTSDDLEAIVDAVIDDLREAYAEDEDDWF